MFAGGLLRNESAQMNIVVLGGYGQVGQALAQCESELPLRCYSSTEIDITQPEQLAQLSLTQNSVVINCAAYTAVDAAETEPERAQQLNEFGARNIAVVTARSGARLIQLSTDYVFSGDKHRGDSWGINEIPAPRTVYGKTKLAGEMAVRNADPRAIIVRTAWVFTGGDGSRDFVGTMRGLAKTRDRIDVVADQIGSPTFAPDLARGLIELAGKQEIHSRILHAAGGGTATWCELAQATLKVIGDNPKKIHPVTTANFPRPAPRPANSVLATASWVGAGLTPFRDWREAITEII